MVCSCKIPIETYPENAEWGPLFWKILHGLAEKSGKQTNINIQKDERHNWILLLKQTQYTLPCDICRNHYSEWLVVNSIDILSTIPYPDMNQWIRNWLWTLHNTINQGNNRPVFPFDDLTPTYSGINITNIWKMLQPVMKKAISLNGISLLPWTKWLFYLRVLQSMY
jgi:hypothetical protein